MHAKHERTLKCAVEASYAGITATWIPPVDLAPVVPGTQGLSGIPFTEPQECTSDSPLVTPQVGTFSLPSDTVIVENRVSLNPIDPDQLLELTWTEDLQDSPSIRYLPPRDTVEAGIVPLPDSTQPNHLKRREHTGSDIALTWRPTIQVLANEPAWVVKRNLALQQLLDSAAPLFVYGADIGTPMCQVCVEHFDNMKLDVDNAWRHDEIIPKRSKKQGSSPDQV